MTHLVFQGCDNAWCQLNVRIQKQRVARRDLLTALFEGPELAAPAGRKRCAVDDAKIRIRERTSLCHGRIIRPIID